MRHTPVKTQCRRWTQMDLTECHTLVAPFLFLFAVSPPLECVLSIENERERTAKFWQTVNRRSKIFIFICFHFHPSAAKFQAPIADSVFNNICKCSAENILAAPSGFLDLLLCAHAIKQILFLLAQIQVNTWISKKYVIRKDFLYFDQPSFLTNCNNALKSENL
jgi:hypothetical protein